jgi:hypothetical protein
VHLGADGFAEPTHAAGDERDSSRHFRFSFG